MKNFLILCLLLFICPGCSTAPPKATARKPEKHVVITKPVHIKPEKTDNLGLTEKERKMSVEELFSIANRYFDTDRYDDAAKYYNAITILHPEKSQTAYSHYNSGLIFMKQQQWSQAANHMKKAFLLLDKAQDKIDALFILFDGLRHSGQWEKIISISDETLNNNPFGLYFSDKQIRELSLKKAEALVRLGKTDEGIKLTNYLLFQIRRGKRRQDLLYNPEYAYAQFILGINHVEEFNRLELDQNNIKTLENKCREILNAQSKFLLSIKAGIIYWSNASAFEIAGLYTKLYNEMSSYQIPENLSEEEKVVYICELWNKISGLLRKARKTLKRSIEAAEKLREENDYTNKSFSMLVKINEIYEERENYCESPEKNFTEEKTHLKLPEKIPVPEVSESRK